MGRRVRCQVRGQFEHAGSAKDASLRASARAILARDARLTSNWPHPRKRVLAVDFKTSTASRSDEGGDHFSDRPLPTLDSGLINVTRNGKGLSSERCCHRCFTDGIID